MSDLSTALSHEREVGVKWKTKRGDEWRRLYRGQPPRLSRDLLIRTTAYRMQELAYGGLSKATQRKSRR